MSESTTKSLGVAIDEIVAALMALPEASRATAVRAACENVGISLELTFAAAPTGRTLHSSSIDQALTTLEGQTVSQDIRSLKDAKRPKSNQEMACIMAYYLQCLAPPSERKTIVSASDIEKYFAQAGFPLPKAPGQVLIDTKGAGYFDAVDRGTYKLNPVGHNLVVHSLPKKDGSGAIRASRAKKAPPAAKKSTRKSR
jgi:hypothetical protein